MEREFLCSFPGSDQETAVYAETRSKARYRFWLDIGELCPDIELIDVSVRVGAKPPPPSTAWRELGLTARQRDIARHALGFDGRQKTSYRNYYCIGPGEDTYDEWMDLAGKKLATRYSSGRYPGEVFHCSKQLALAVTEGYETLDREYYE